MNKEANFLHLFEIQRIIKQNDANCKDIVDKLRKDLSNDEWKQLLLIGIEQCFDKLPKTNPLLYNIHTSLSQSEMAIQIENSNARQSSCHEALNIQNIKSKILTYLDIESVRKTSRVSIQWLYDTYRPESYSYFQQIDGTWRDSPRITDIPTFRFVSKLNLDRWISPDHDQKRQSALR